MKYQKKEGIKNPLDFLEGANGVHRNFYDAKMNGQEALKIVAEDIER